MILLIHWNADEAAERLERLRAAGLQARHESVPSPALLKSAAEDPPEAAVIDLSRMPSHGREIACALRRRKATRSVPIVFVDGEPEKAAAIRELLPDAIFSDWGHVASALAEAIAHANAAPAVPPDPMARYANRPLAKKLELKPGMQVLLLGEGCDIEALVGDTPEGVTFRTDARAKPGMVIWRCVSLLDLEAGIDWALRMARGAPLWIAWPKDSPSKPDRLSMPIIRLIASTAGLVDRKVCSLDAKWSAMLFAPRRLSR